MNDPVRNFYIKQKAQAGCSDFFHEACVQFGCAKKYTKAEKRENEEWLVDERG